MSAMRGRRDSNTRRISDVTFRVSANQFASREEAAASVRSWCEKAEGSVLKAWLKLFDPDFDQSVASPDFGKAMRVLGYTALNSDLVRLLDEDASGEVSLNEIDPVTAKLWNRFRKWCLQEFNCVAHMLQALGGPEAAKAAEISFEAFTEGLANLGWVSEHPQDEDILCRGLDTDSTGALSEKNLSFLTVELARAEKKRKAKVSAARETKPNPNDPNYLATVLSKFKRFLRRRYGGHIRAWRCAISPGGQMTLQKVQFVKACANIGYNDNFKSLWKAFYKDDSSTSISADEIDLKGAEALADFRNFIKDQFGNSTAAFRALDMDGSRRVLFQEFAKALKAHDYLRPPKLLFECLDRYNNRTIVEEDLKFLDDWKPLPFLACQPNPAAAAQMKELLQQNYKTKVKGYRRCLDPSGNNRCNFFEFEQGCAKMGFKGDVPGAFRGLDLDLNGYISLFEIDAPASKAIFEFRLWAEDEFGSIPAAFEVFDEDSSSELTFKEFVRCCHIFGYEGNCTARELFHALDLNKDRSISYQELYFLSNWTLPKEEFRKRRKKQSLAVAADSDGDENAGSVRKSQLALQYQTVAEKLGRLTRCESMQKGKLPSVDGAAPKEEPANQEEKIEPLNRPTMESAYGKPPYRLSQAFKSARHHSPTNSILGAGPWSARETYDLLSKDASTASIPTMSELLSARSAPQATPRSMPTLDELLLPVAIDEGGQDCWHISPRRQRAPHHGNSARRHHRSRGREKLAALESTPRNPNTT